jgi:hypothetical protein
MNLVYSVLTSLIFSINLSSNVPYAQLEKAFEANNAKAIVALGKTKVLMNVLGKEGVYSQSQASLVLKDFFSKKPGNNFSFVFQGKEAAEGAFAIGNYLSKKSEKFRVTIYFKMLGSVYRIESLTIEAV